MPIQRNAAGFVPGDLVKISLPGSTYHNVRGTVVAVTRDYVKVRISTLRSPLSYPNYAVVHADPMGAALPKGFEVGDRVQFRWGKIIVEGKITHTGPHAADVKFNGGYETAVPYASMVKIEKEPTVATAPSPYTSSAPKVRATLGASTIEGHVAKRTGSPDGNWTTIEVNASDQVTINSDVWTVVNVVELPRGQFAMVQINADVYVRNGAYWTRVSGASPVPAFSDTNIGAKAEVGSYKVLFRGI